MKKRFISMGLVISLCTSLLCIFPISVGAKTEGYYEYSISNGGAIIESCDNYISGEVVVPETLGGYPVIGIGVAAFSNCDIVTKISIPDSVGMMSGGSFYMCLNLEEVDTYETKTSNLGEGAVMDGFTVWHCPKLKSFSIPASVKSIEYHAFVPYDVACEPDFDSENPPENGTFSGGVLSNIDVGEGVEYINPEAFWYCDALESFHISGGEEQWYSIINEENKWYLEGYRTYFKKDNFFYTFDGDSIIIEGEGDFSLVDGVLFNKSQTKILRYPIDRKGGYTIPEGVKTIGENAFKNATNLTEIIIPKSVTNIEKNAFYGCSGLKKINYNGFKSQWNSIVVDDGNSVLSSVDIELKEGVFVEIRDGDTGELIPGATARIYYNYSDNGTVLRQCDGTVEYDLTFPISFIDVENVGKYRYWGPYSIQNRPADGKLVLYVYIPSGPKYEYNDPTPKDEWNFNPNVYSKELALTAITLSSKAYDDAVGASLSRYMSYDLGLSGIRSSGTWGDNNEHNCSFVIGSKKIGDRDIVYVTIRGTDGVEWMGNMDFCGESYNSSYVDEYSFRLAADNLKAILEDYLRKYGLENSILFITGHSRGAAVANLVAADYTSSGSYFSDVYAYCFATPNTTKAPRYYSNIFNFCYSEDFVTAVPLADWGYGKHGRTYDVSAQYSYATDSDFKTNMNNLFRTRGYDDEEGSYFNLQNRINLVYNVYKTWKTPYSAYTRTDYKDYHSGLHAIGATFHNYMKNGIGRLMAGVSTGRNALLTNGIATILSTNLIKEYSPVSSYFVNGSVVNSYITYTHEATTYAVGVENDIFTSENVSMDASVLMLMSTETSTTQDEEETKKIKEFLQQNDNLTALGWDIDDITTWNGVMWSDGHVTEIDLEFSNLTGNLNLSDFSKLKTFNVLGNDLEFINLSNCNELEIVNVDYNKLTELKLENCTQLKELSCNGNELENLDISDCTECISLKCSDNMLSSIDLSSNQKLNKLYCSNNALFTLDLNSSLNIVELDITNNYFDIYDDTELNDCIGNLKEQANFWYQLLPQKVREDIPYSQSDINVLQSILSYENNEEVLGWDFTDIGKCYGVAWELHSGEMRISAINLDSYGISGDISISCLPYLKSLSLNNTKISSLTISNCRLLSYVSCNDAALKSINTNDCAVKVLYCDNNYLNDFSNINLTAIQDISLIDQKPNTDEFPLNQAELDSLLSFLEGDNINVLGWDIENPEEWNGITWIAINNEYHIAKIDMSFSEINGNLDLRTFKYLNTINLASTNINSIILPDDMEDINNVAFYDCKELKESTINSKVQSIGEKAFYGCNNLADIYYSGTIEQWNDITIGASNESLMNVKIHYSEPVVSFSGGDGATGTAPETMKGEVITMPQNPFTKEGYKFAGWYAEADGCKVFLPEYAEYNVTADTEFTAVWVDISMEPGATVRVLAPAGLRFTSSIDTNGYNTIKSTDANAICGTIVAPLDYFEGNDFTKLWLTSNGKTYLDIETKDFSDETDLVKTWRSAVSNIKMSNYTRPFSGRGYIEFTYTNGTTGIIYTDFNKEDNARAIAVVSQDILKNNADNYTVEQIETLKSFVESIQ